LKEQIELKRVNRLSKRLKPRELPTYLASSEGGAVSAAGGSDGGNSFGTINTSSKRISLAAKKVEASRKACKALLEAETVDPNKRYTVSYMCRLGLEPKKGFLLKQGKFIGRYVGNTFSLKLRG
jgi:hypothetical protein